ncbi:DgyrCDS502 [Dimorphilus gyrociliatus]|uniref:DgyrCDS502 n=1 Tax=Dimorphilus gyrociliatus TaxID=2664684 RepID=A0A7I8V4U1_9ANNE|nr:DgyrCDS502 [Dimorphilus gyrociliatus]
MSSSNRERSPSQDAYKRGRGTQSPRSTTASISHPSPYGIRMPMTAAAAYSLPYSTAQYTTSPYQSDVPQPRRRISMLNNEFESHRILEPAALNSAKRPRMMQDYTQPLHINTQFVPNIKQEPAYHPQVEAISPTLPQDQGFKDARQNITNQINKVESRIQELEATIKKLESDEERYKAAACAPAGERCESPTQKHQNPLHDILSDNKRKAAKSHQLIILSSKLENVQGLALYQQPSDTLQEEIKEKFIKFKPLLVAQLKKKFFAKKEREKGSDDLYKKQMQIWLKKVDRFENAAKKKSKDVRTRELYEKVFPEIKRVREERCNNRAHTRSEHQEIDQINDGVQEHEEEIRKRKQLAVIPPLLLDEQERKYKFIDNNRLIKDPLAEYKNSKGKDTVWTDKEKEVFRDRFVQHPKNFVIISQFLENKTVSECIHYYYMSKKTENYKQLVRKHQARQRGAKGALKKQAVMRAAQLEKDRCEQEAKNKSKEEAVPIVFSRSNRSSFVDVKPMVVTAGCAVRSLENQDEPCSNSAPPSNNENREKSSNIQCVVCSTKTCSNFYSVTSANHSSYGISSEAMEEAVKRDGEVKICNNCRIRQRRKSFECPLMACSRPKTKVKRLRPLPNKLKTVAEDIRDDIFKTFGITDGMNKCCQPCFNRICRRLGTNDPETEANRWTDEEMTAAKEALKDFGRNWAAISTKVGTKSEAQCKHFFFNYRKKMGLDDLLKEHTDNRKTSVCESNASTVTAISDSEMPSSVDDEIEGISDETASIASVRTLEEDNSKFPAADNDSSATLSADESSQDAVLPKHQQVPQQPLHSQQHVSKNHSVSVIQKPPNPVNLAQENFLPAIARLQTAQPSVNGGLQQAGEDRRHSPACVRDLIHSAIERNLHPDVPRSDSDATKENIARVHPITMATSNPMGINVSISNPLYPDLLGPRHYRPDPLNRKKEQPRGPPPPAHSNHSYSRPPHFNIPPRPHMPVPPPLVHNNNRPLMAGGSIISGTPLAFSQRQRFEGRPPPPGLDGSAGSIIKGTPICNENMKGTHGNHDIYEVAAPKAYDRHPSNNRLILQNDYDTARQMENMRTSANIRPAYIDAYDDREKPVKVNRHQQSKSPRSVPISHHHQHPHQHQQHAQMPPQQSHPPQNNQMTAAKLIDIIIHNQMTQEKTTNSHTLTSPRRRRPNESEMSNSMPGMTRPKRPSPPPDRKITTIGNYFEQIIENKSQKVEEDMRANSRISQSMRGIIGSPPEDQKQSQLSPFAASPRPSSISPASTSPRNEKAPSLQSVLDVDTRPRSYSAGPCSKPETKRPSPAVSPQPRVRANTVTAPSPVVKKHQNLANMLNKSSADNSVATSPEAESPASSPKMIIDESASNEPPKQED